MSKARVMSVFAGLLLACCIGMQPAEAASKKLKVFILAGQSNMEGPAKISTFDYIGDDPLTAPMYKEMVGADGKPVVCENAWISYLTGVNGKNFEITGRLTAGYGSMWGQDPTKPGKCIGPEFTFGIHMEKALKQPILIVKTAWGGKSLHTDFRPPSAGPYMLPKVTQEQWDKYPQGAHGIPKVEDRKKWRDERDAATGVFYRAMIEHVKKVLADIKRVYPEYKEAQGYEIAGFVWLQGWNDLVDRQTYPDQGKPGRYNEYSRLLECLIRDVRKDLNVPKMPFVIGVMGVGGETDTAKPNHVTDFRLAMAAPAEQSEFKGNVIAVQTAPFWDAKLALIDQKRNDVRQMRYFLDSKHKDHPNADGHMTDAQKGEYIKGFEAKHISPEDNALWTRGASNAGYHYLGCAKTFAQMGKAFAEAVVKLQK